MLNGWELGSGSIRIHEPELQQRVFDLLGIDEEEANRRFGFFLTPFRYGAPPHGGFAFGIDRLAAILAGEENIREVIAFPKTQSGTDPMTNAPTPVDERHLRELGLRLLPPEVVNETTTWLAADPVVERVELADRSWVDVVRGLVPAADAVHDELVANVAWEQGKVFRYERWIDEPRLGAVPEGRRPAPGAARGPAVADAALPDLAAGQRARSPSTATSATASASTATASCAGWRTRSSAC